MRILLVSDLHYTLRQFDWLTQAAGDFDLVVLAGDHLDISSPVPLDAQAIVVANYMTLLSELTTVVVSSGNHDLTGADANGENGALWMSAMRRDSVHTDGDSVMHSDALLTVCPWWDGPVGRQTVAGQFAADASRRPAHWIWVYHWPPTDSPTSWTGTRHYGDADLAAWITEYRPDVVLSGHVHGPPFKPDGSWVDRIGTTWVFNPGRQIGPVPARIELDLDERTATWLSMMGVEQADLEALEAPPRTVF